MSGTVCSTARSMGFPAMACSTARSSRRTKELKGLYLAGGAAHPGPGMPMVMMSGWIAADSLDQDARENVLAAAVA
jgi:phytoene dehydrogenase-like protein